MTTRARWAAILPIVQAFVDGVPVQRLDYDQRWKDADYLADLLHAKYRIRPLGAVSGTWEQDYTYEEPGRIDGPVATGVLRWQATSLDEPRWPSGHGYSLVGKPRFIPDGNEASL